MGVIEDTRKVLQDFVAPELRAITVRLDALEKRVEGVDKKIDEVDKRAEKRFDDVERRAEKRHDEVLSAMRGMQDWTSIQERLARLESRDATH